MPSGLRQPSPVDHAPMPQPGSTTTITTRTRLILLDCFETLVELDAGVYRARQGVAAFLAHYRTRQPTPMAVISDAGQSVVEAAIGQAGLLAAFATIYHAGNASEALPGGRARKRLDLPLRDFAVHARLAVFIGDSPLDAMAASHHDVPFIRVPRSEDRDFSFATLIGGPSRYDSAQFSAAFLERNLRDRERPS